jgi:xanthine/uracil permease
MLARMTSSGDEAPHSSAIAVTIVTVAVFAIVAVTFIRRLNAAWILIVPIIGGIAAGVCLLIAGQKSDHAAISVETLHAAESIFSPGLQTPEE